MKHKSVCLEIEFLSKKLKSAYLLTALLLSIVPQVFAYGPAGHKLVGAIADQLIQGTRAAREVNKILAGRTLEEVSVWADCAKNVVYKGNNHFVYQADDMRYPDCKIFDNTRDKIALEQFVQRNWHQCQPHAHNFRVLGAEPCHKQYHYTDVSNFHDHYQVNYVGASDHDIVHAISAAILVLQNKTPAPPFEFKNKKEALMLLTHYLGDIHQPLHVVAIYLDPQGRPIDPDAEQNTLVEATAGGNKLIFEHTSLHRFWDQVPAHFWALSVDHSRAPSPLLLQAARSVKVSPGRLQSWPIFWADDTIKASVNVFSGLQFNPISGAEPQWSLVGVDQGYRAKADDLKAREIAAAGARLAQVLTRLWPDIK